MRRRADKTVRGMVLAIAAVVALVALGVYLQTSPSSSFCSEGSAGSDRLGGSDAAGPAGPGAAVPSETEAVGAGQGSGSTQVRELFAQLSGQVDEDGCARGEAVFAVDVPEAGAELLSAYRDRKDCLLVRSGYLDLYGEMWGCVVQGDGWVDVCVLRAEESGAGCAATAVRMDAEAWASSAAAEGYGQVDEGAG